MSEGQGSGVWAFTVPQIVERLSTEGNVLKIVCREPGTGPVTATYNDESGAAEGGNTVTCLGAPPTTTSAPASTSASALDESAGWGLAPPVVVADAGYGDIAEY